jgi:hypothetical protein
MTLISSVKLTIEDIAQSARRVGSTALHSNEEYLRAREKQYLVRQYYISLALPHKIAAKNLLESSIYDGDDLIKLNTRHREAP